MSSNLFSGGPFPHHRRSLSRAERRRARRLGSARVPERRDFERASFDLLLLLHRAQITGLRERLRHALIGLMSLDGCDRVASTLRFIEAAAKVHKVLAARRRQRERRAREAA